MSIVWKSELSSEMVADLTPDQMEKLSEQLDYVIETICTDWGIE